MSWLNKMLSTTVPMRPGRSTAMAATPRPSNSALRELRIDMPMSRAALKLICRELMRRNHLSHGFLYMQVTRGVAPRDHAFPKRAKPALAMTTRQTKPHSAELLGRGVAVITVVEGILFSHDIRKQGY